MKSVNNNNKGFSLVELIVVIAIMAVLIGVLSPQYLRYVEKSRLQKDNSAISEIVQSVKTAMADETINKSVDGSWSTTSEDKAFAFDEESDDLVEKELAATVGAEVELTSNTYTSSEAAELTITAEKDGGNVNVTVENFIEAVDGEATDKEF